MQILRMENSERRGPFSPDAAYAGDRSFEQAYAATADMWRNVPWVEVYPDGLHALDETHVHHLADCLGMDDETTAMCEQLHLPVLQGDWTVGCKDKRQFFHWFPPKSLADFERHGMRLDVYDCPSSAVKAGQYQVMFDPSKAKLVKSEPLTALLSDGKAN